MRTSPSGSVRFDAPEDLLPALGAERGLEEKFLWATFHGREIRDLHTHRQPTGESIPGDHLRVPGCNVPERACRRIPTARCFVSWNDPGSSPAYEKSG